MNHSDLHAQENANWADFCDALHAERWTRRIDAAKRSKLQDDPFVLEDRRSRGTTAADAEVAQRIE